MRDLMISLFGLYQPVQYVTIQGDTIIPAGMSGVDWTYVLGIGLFALTLFCVFRLIGGAFSAINRR